MLSVDCGLVGFPYCQVEKILSMHKVFSKCKASIKDGHRLENISWRLWHLELALAPSEVAQDETRGRIAGGPMEDGSNPKELILLDEKAPVKDALPLRTPG